MADGIVSDRSLRAFLFTDIEGSTPSWAAEPAAMEQAVARHDEILEAVIAGHGGCVFTRAGDSFAAAFADPASAVAAASAVHERLEAEPWPTRSPIRVRVGVHVGTAQERGGDYFGPAVNEAARAMSAGHGGQTLVTDTVLAVLPGLEALRLGEVNLRGFDEPVVLHQVGDGNFGPLRVDRPARRKLPVFPTTLFGRTEETTEINASLARHRCVTLQGIGGIGKTRLAVAVADEMVGMYTNGVYFADLVAVTDDSEVAAAIIEAIGLHPGTADPAAELIDHLASSEILVVLDNCEHVVEAAANVVADVLSRPGATRFLATSRERLDIDGEHVIGVRPLSSGVGSPARELFLDRAMAVHPEFAPDQEALTAVDELCVHLDGLPLAIELAASRITVMTPQELLERIDDRLRLLSGGRRRRQSRERTLVATLDWSHDLLDDNEQAALRRLAVFVGSFDVDAVAAVTETDTVDALNVLERLAAKSLVAPSTNQARRRFRLLETVRAYASDRLAADDDPVGASERMANHFADRARQIELIDAFGFDITDHLEPDMGNLAATYEFFADRGDWTAPADVVSACFGVFWNRGRSLEGVEWSKRCLDHADDLDSDRTARLHVVLAYAAMQRLQFDEMLAHAKRAAQTETTDDFAGVISLIAPLIMLTGAPRDMIDRSMNRRHLDRATRAAQLTGDPRIYNTVQVFALADNLQHGEYEVMLDSWRSSCRLPLASFNDVCLASGAASAALLTQSPIEALRIADEAFDGSETWDPGDLLRALAYLDLGDEAAARQHLARFCATAVQGRLPGQDHDALLGIARLAAATGDNDRARRIVLTTLLCRSPDTCQLLYALAEDLGVADQHRDLMAASFAAGNMWTYIPGLLESEMEHFRLNN